MERGFLAFLIGLLVIALLFVFARSCAAQTAEASVAFEGKEATTFAMSRAPSVVSVRIWRELRDTSAVRAIVSPRRFHVGAHERQVIRVRLAEACDSGMRFVVLFTPDAPAITKTEHGVRASITIATQLVSRVTCS